MSTEAIDSDTGADSGTGPSGGDAVGTDNEARLALMNQINDQNDAAFEDQYADINDDGTTAPFVAPTFKDPDADESEELQETDDGPAAASLPTMVKLKVNGKEKEVTYEEALVMAQKVASADEYLQQASQARQQALVAAKPVAPQPPPAPVPQVDPAAEVAKRRALARAIQMGTEEEAVAAIAELQNTSRQPTLSVADISRVTDERLKFNGAINWFNQTYNDLVTNPQLHRMVLDADAALIRGGDKRPYAERYAEVGNAVREWRDNLIRSTGATPAPAQGAPVSSLDAKRAAKAAAPRAPVAANAKAVPQREEEQDESPSAVIAAMAKARGGPQWARG